MFSSTLRAGRKSNLFGLTREAKTRVKFFRLDGFMVFCFTRKSFHTLMHFDLLFQPIVEIKEIRTLPIALDILRRPRLLQGRRNFTQSLIQDGGSFGIELTIKDRNAPTTLEIAQTKLTILPELRIFTDGTLLSCLRWALKTI